MKKSTKIILTTLIVCMLSIAITWGEVALILVIVKWIGVKFAFFKWSVLLTAIVIFIKGFFNMNSKK